jgi:Periplasmic copper-binding protein (NosD)
MRSLFVPLALLTLLAPGLGLATPIWTDATKAQALIDAVVADEGAGQAAVGQLAGILHLDAAVQAPVIAPPPAFADWSVVKLISTDLQLAMTQLSMHIGSNNQIRVLRAQGDRRDALIVQSGFTTLRDLAKTAEDQGIDGLRMVNGVARLTRPLVVWLGAGLKLEPGDELQMEGASGAFLLGFGQIEMLGASVHAGRTGAAPEAFRPFVLITGQGTIYAERTKFTGLGMVGADPFGGVVVSQRGLFEPEFPPTLSQNTFEDVGVLGFIGVTNGVIAGNLVKSGRGGGISLVGVQHAQVTENVVVGTKGGAGVKVANGTDVQLAGNLISGGARNGISIGGNSKGVRISGNAVLTNAETGIASQRATCVLVTGNSIARNGASGLRLNESGVSRVQGNALVLNTNSGLHVGAQRKGGRIEVADNLLAGNRVGLTGVAIGEVVLDQNNLSGQMPRLFDGEFSQYLAAYLTQVQQHSDKSYRILARDGQQADAFLTACNKG